MRQCLPALERMLGYFIQRRNAQGLFKLDDVGAHWYYDAITTGGINGYYNAFFYKAALDLAEMEHAAGRQAQAADIAKLAESIKAAFNRVLWKEDAPGGPRYLDWIDAQGQEVSYFCDLCQWPPIAVGIASPEQARKIVATADARIAELEKEHGYQGYAGLSALWPVPQPLNPHKWQTYGRYMNGGSLLCQTYWEIVARARAGDAAGAADDCSASPSGPRRSAGRATMRPTSTARCTTATASPTWPTWWPPPPRRSTAYWGSSRPGISSS